MTEHAGEMKSDKLREIIPNLFQIPVPLPDNPLRELNAYLIRGTDRSLLIDTGFRLPPCRGARPVLPKKFNAPVLLSGA